MAAPSTDFTKEIWGYDFDGVLHTLMQKGDNPFKLSGSRHPDHSQLHTAYEKGKFVKLMNQHRNVRTFKDINFALKHKIPIYIVSSNKDIKQVPRFFVSHKHIEIE